MIMDQHTITLIIKLIAIICIVAASIVGAFLYGYHVRGKDEDNVRLFDTDEIE